MVVVAKAERRARVKIILLVDDYEVRLLGKVFKVGKEDVTQHVDLCRLYPPSFQLFSASFR